MVLLRRYVLILNYSFSRFTTSVTKGSATYFNQGVVDSVTLVTAGSSAETGCYWDMTGVSLRQDIPEAQDPGTYTIGMVLTIS